MEEKRWGFPNENDTCRIQKLYYDVNINTIFNRTKLRNLKKKFVKYVKFITKFKQNIVDPEIHTYQKIQDDAYQRVNESRVDDASQTSFTNEDVEKGQALFEIFNDAKDDCDKVKYYSLYWAESIEHIYNKINEIKKQQGVDVDDQIVDKYSGWTNPLSWEDDGMDDDQILNMGFDYSKLKEKEETLKYGNNDLD